MKTFLNVLKTDYLRTLPRVAPTIVMTLITLGSILLAVYITGEQQVKGHIVWIRTSASQTVPKSTKDLEITVRAKKPPLSDFICQKYDASVTLEADGTYRVDTLRGSSFKKMVLLLLANPNARVPSSEDQRSVGENIIGFMMMFLLMASFSNLFAFAEDKEQGQLRRIAASPAPLSSYLAAHCVYCFSLLLPEFLLLCVLKAGGWKIGFSLGQYAGLMALLGFLGISFSLFLHTLISKPDNADMLGSAVTVLASVLAGSFYSFTKKNAVMDALISLLPQKQVMDFAKALQNGDAWSRSGSALYPFGFSLVLFLVSCILLRRMYVKRPGSRAACQTPAAGIE